MTDSAATLTITLALAGNQQAYADLYQFSLRCSLPVVARMLWNRPQDVADVAHDTVVKALMKLHLFRGTARYRTWLRRVVINHVLMVKREARKEALDLAQPIQGWESDEGEMVMAESALGLAIEERGFRQVEAAVDLGRLMPWGSEASQELIREHFIEGKRSRDLARERGVHVGTVKSNMSRTLGRMRVRAKVRVRAQETRG